MAEAFCAKFGAGPVGHVLGLLHDLGKYNPDFQAYLQACWAAQQQGKRPPVKSAPHAVYGAALAAQGTLPALALPLMGHHAGLGERARVFSHLRTFLSSPEYQSVLQQAQQACPALALPSVAPPSVTDPEMWLRMVFSALVDADYLDTEQHFDPGRSALRGSTVTVQDLWHALEADQGRLLEQAERDGGSVNRVRAEVYAACLDAARERPGIYRLAVPTGGGKTRSGLAFALKHAVEHDLERVVVAVPYTSITTQTAHAYRQIFQDLPPDAVLEHHSALDVNALEADVLNRAYLAAENWDAPLVVTTTVQLFESLFANRPGRCRKLHRLARSVIVLDEVQTLPTHLLQPTLDALNALVRDYGASIVLCTATQPALELSGRVNGFALGSVRDIVPPETAREHFRRLRRVTYHTRSEPTTLAALAQELRQHPQVLVILNTRRDALALLEALDDPEALHLSTLLCGAHRRDVLARVRAQLHEKCTVRLIATQVVEAGVDLDFPVVYRAFGPLDRIVQAAGRCNREGHLPQGGNVHIVQLEEGRMPRGDYQTATELAQMFLLRPELDLHDPEVFQDYFRRVYGSINPDRYKVNEARQDADYPLTQERYRVINEDTRHVVVPYGDAPAALLARLRQRGYITRQDWRELSAYTVALRSYEISKYQAEGLLTSVLPDTELWEWTGLYCSQRGLRQAGRATEDFVV